MSCMRILRLLSLCTAIAIPIPLFSQVQPEPASFVLKLEYKKIELPYSMSTTCLAVFPDGRLHLEKNSGWPSSKPEVFEDSLTGEGFKFLTAVLETKELKELQTRKEHVAISHGEYVWAVISRGDAFQNLKFAGLEGSGGQPARPLPEPIRPLVQWLQTTIKALSQRKQQALKNTKPVSCWLLKGEREIAPILPPARLPSN